MNWLKRLFLKKEPQECKSITCGERDDDGFADLYVNGNKTKTKVLLFDKKAVEKIQQITEKLTTEI